MSGPSSMLYKTQLCNFFERNNGKCTRPNCTYAHGIAELRRPGETSFTTDRRPNLESDLRHKLRRQYSPERRRPSLDRDGRREHRFSGHENPRPFEQRDRDYRENHRFDDRQDYPGGNNRTEERREDGRKNFSGYNNGLEDQLKDVELDVKMLTHDKQRLEASIERREEEADVLNSRIRELETQLGREKEESKRITASTRKFVKEYNRFLRAQDDLKRSQARLEKLGNQLSIDLAGDEIDIMSGEENNGLSLRAAYDPQKTSDLPKKRRYVDQYTTKEHVRDASVGRRGGEEEKDDREKRNSRCNAIASKSYSEEESRLRNDEETTMNKSSSPKEDGWKRRKLSSSINKVMSSQSIADETFDDEENPEVAVSPLRALPPPPPLRDFHFQDDIQEEEEELNEEVNVDVVEQKKTNDVDTVQSA